MITTSTAIQTKTKYPFVAVLRGGTSKGREVKATTLRRLEVKLGQVLDGVSAESAIVFFCAETYDIGSHLATAETTGFGWRYTTVNSGGRKMGIA